MGNPLLPPPPKKKPSDVNGGLLPPPPKKEEFSIDTVAEDQQPESRVFDPIKQYREQKPGIPKVVQPTFKEQSAITPESTEVEQGIMSRKEEIAATPEAKEYTRKEKEYNAIKPAADQYRNFAGKRSEQHDFPALQSEYERAGGIEKLRAEDNLDRAYKDVDEDYLDVLAATKPELYQENKNRLDAIEAKQKEGKPLTDYDEKFRVEFRNKALSYAGAAEKANIYEIQNTSNVQEYQKQTAELSIEADRYKKEYDTLIGQIGERPPTTAERAKLDELSKKSQNVIQRFEAAQEETGVTPEVRESLDTSYKKLASLGIAYDDNEKRYDVGLKKDIDQLKKEERTAALKSGNPIVALDEFMRATSGAVSSGVQSIAQVPKVFGDLTGDTDYDWADKMYNFAKNVKDETESDFGRPAEFDNMPTWMKIPTYLGEGMGSVTSLAAGAATMGGGRLATMGSAFLTSEADYYQAALDAGATPKEAAAHATAIASVTSMLEGIIPDTKYFEPAAFRKSVLKEVTAGKTFKEALKSNLDNVLTVAADYSKNVGKGFVKEAGEEGLQQLGEDVTKETINKIAGQEYYTDTFNPDTYKEAMLIGGLTGGVFNAISSLREKSPTQEGQLFDAAGDRENIVAKIAQIDEVRAVEVDQLLTEAEKMKKGWEKIPQFQKLTPEKQAHVVAESLRAKQLNKTAKEVGMADEATDLEVKAIEEEVAGIVRTGRTSTEVKEDQERISAEEQKIADQKNFEQEQQAMFESQPEELSKEELKVKESLGEKIYTIEDVDSMLEENEVIEECPPGYVKAENGIQTGLRKGGKWDIVHEFKGKSHKEGGIDIEIVGGKVKASNEDGSFKAEDGAVWQVDGAPEETEYEKAQRLGDAQGGLTTGVATAINPIVGAVVGAGQKIGGNVRTGAEATDENGNLINRRKARTMGILGSFLDPLKALTTRASYKGGFGDISGNKYLASIEQSAKANLLPDAPEAQPMVPTAMQQQQQAIAGELAGMRQQAGIQPQQSAPMVGNGGMIAGAEMQTPQLSGGLQTIEINGAMYGYDSIGNFIKIA